MFLRTDPPLPMSVRRSAAVDSVHMAVLGMGIADGGNCSAQA